MESSSSRIPKESRYSTLSNRVTYYKFHLRVFINLISTFWKSAVRKLLISGNDVIEEYFLNFDMNGIFSSNSTAFAASINAVDAKRNRSHCAISFKASHWSK